MGFVPQIGHRDTKTQDWVPHFNFESVHFTLGQQKWGDATMHHSSPPLVFFSNKISLNFSIPPTPAKRTKPYHSGDDIARLCDGRVNAHQWALMMMYKELVCGARSLNHWGVGRRMIRIPEWFRAALMCTKHLHSSEERTSEERLRTDGPECEIFAFFPPRGGLGASSPSETLKGEGGRVPRMFQPICWERNHKKTHFESTSLTKRGQENDILRIQSHSFVEILKGWNSTVTCISSGYATHFNPAISTFAKDSSVTSGSNFWVEGGVLSGRKWAAHSWKLSCRSLIKATEGHAEYVSEALEGRPLLFFLRLYTEEALDTKRPGF